MKDFSKDSEYILKGRIHGRHIPAYDQGAGKTIDKYDLHLCRLCRHIGSMIAASLGVIVRIPRAPRVLLTTPSFYRDPRSDSR